MPAGGAGSVRRGAGGDALTLPSPHRLVLQIDGTPGAQRSGMAGVGIVVRDVRGWVVGWSRRQMPATTSNEAEYQALIAGLEWIIRRYTTAHVCCLTDSEIVVAQMTGRAAVRAAALQPLHSRASALVQQVGAAEFVAIPRELNRLADALAWEALGGQQRIVRAMRTTSSPPGKTTVAFDT